MNYKEIVANKILRRYAELKNWRTVAREFDVSVATVWRIANDGYEPKDPEIRNKLNYPQVIKQTVYRDEHGRFRKAGE